MRKLAQTIVSGAVPRQASRSAMLTVAMAALMAAFAIVATIYVRHHILLAFSHVSQTQDMQARVSAIQTAVLEAEAARRRFVITRDAGALTVFDNTQNQFSDHMRRLSANGRQTEAISAAAQLYSERAAAALQAIGADVERWRARPDDPRQGVTATAQTESLIIKTRAAADALEKQLDVRLAQQRSDIFSAVTMLVITVSILVMGLGFILIAQTRELLLQTAGRVQSESRASREIAGLSDQVSRTRAELSLSHRQLELALRSARVQVFSLAPDGAIEWVSDPHSGVLRAAPFRLEDLVEEPERAALSSRISAARAEGAPLQFEMRARRDGASGGDWLRIDILPQTDGPAALGSAVDITELKERESRMFWLMRELSHRSKNLLAIVQAIARQTARGGAVAGRVRTALSGAPARSGLGARPARGQILRKRGSGRTDPFANRPGKRSHRRPHQAVRAGAEAAPGSGAKSGHGLSRTCRQRPNAWRALEPERQPRFSSLKKSLPLSSMTMKAGKFSTSMRQIASMPSSGYSSTSTFLMQSWARRAAGPPIEPR
jgi:CHASE3 domain sensor protein